MILALLFLLDHVIITSDAVVAQLVEHPAEDGGVVSSSLTRGIFENTVAEVIIT